MALQEELKQQGDFLFKYRSYFPLILIVWGMIVVVALHYGIINKEKLILYDGLRGIALYVGLLGLFIRAYTVGFAKKHTSGRNTKEGQVAESLNTEGIYSLVRNPLYLGNYLMWVSLAMLTGFLGFVVLFTLVFWIYYERIIFAEETFLREKFGGHYLKWASNTPPFIPRLSGYRKNTETFNWKDVLKRERNGLLALFLLFLVFDGLINYLEKGSIVIEPNVITIGFAVSLIAFVIIKTLEKTTKLLD